MVPVLIMHLSRTYTGEVIPVKGFVVVNVSNDSKTYFKLKLVVVSGDCACLIACGTYV